MSAELWLLAGFFVFVMGAIALLGYLFVLEPRTASGPGRGAAIQSAVANALQRVGEAVPVAPTGSTSLRGRLAAAGYRSPTAVSVFHGLKVAAGILLGLLLGWLDWALQGRFGGAVLPALCAAGIGYLLPDRVLKHRIKARMHRLRCALPAALDLLVLSLEAGQSLDQAIIDTARELRHAEPELAAELSIVQLEMQVGKTRSEALRNLADRVQEPEIRKLVSLIVESDRFGTSPGAGLSTHALHLRRRLRQQAQESARKVGVKLVFPVFFLILPSFLLVTLGPAVIQLYTQLSALLGEK